MAGIAFPEQPILGTCVRSDDVACFTAMQRQVIEHWHHHIVAVCPHY